MTLTDFLLARIAEDEGAALRASESPTPPPNSYQADPAAPARLLAECRVKRQIVVLAYEATGLDQTVDMERVTGARGRSGVHYVGDRILRAMARIYEGHPDFDPEWSE